MTRRPSFQFYPGDWQGNSNLRRCTLEERGAWVEVLCLMHDSSTQYGVLPWPIKQIAQAAGCKPAILQSLAEKQVLKGADPGDMCAAFTFTPRHAGRDGESVTLIPAQPGPFWYSSRMVKDEYIRLQRGKGTRFEEESNDGESDSPNPSPNPAPIPPFGDGPSSSSSSSIKEYLPPKRGRVGKRTPEDLGNYPEELRTAVSEWRGLLGALRSPEIAEAFPPDKRFLPSGVGTHEATWKAWQKRTAALVKGHRVTDADVLEAGRLWATVKLNLAQKGERLAAPMLPTLINSDEFVDALVRAVETRIAKEADDEPISA